MEPNVTVMAAEKAAGEAPHARLFPHITGMGSVSFLAGIILLFAGVEVHAVHANEMEDPARQFPESMFLAAVIIFCLFTLGSLSVAAVVPADQISLTAGLMVNSRYPGNAGSGRMPAKRQPVSQPLSATRGSHRRVLRTCRGVLLPLSRCIPH